eukprot:9164649-Karenia_brevis.AAC.1
MGSRWVKYLTDTGEPWRCKQDETTYFMENSDDWECYIHEGRAWWSNTKEPSNWFYEDTGLQR